MPEPRFEQTMRSILAADVGETRAVHLLDKSPLLGYIGKKTRAVNRGSKARGSFANLYAIYILVEDYIKQGYMNRNDYNNHYEGARYTDLFKRQRELPFGAKLQNHGLNSRMNDEFRKYYPDLETRSIIRDVASQRYWFNEDLLLVDGFNIAPYVIAVIDAYIAARRSRFVEFISQAQQIESLGEDSTTDKYEFVKSLLASTVDARIFEIVSFSIMKIHYGNEIIWFGMTRESVVAHNLVLYKTGRTNANDGGIDFVMRPVGRFFQVTETLDLRKYFLDIEKVQRFPITFVIKTDLSTEDVRKRLLMRAKEVYGVDRVVETYMNAIEEVVTIPTLLDYLEESLANGEFAALLSEIVLHSRVEYNLDDDEEAMAQSFPPDS